MSSTTGFRHLGRDCPICSGNYHRRDCRESLTTGFVFCRDTTANPGGQWRYLKDDANGCPVWAWGEGESTDRPLKVTFTPAAPAASAVPIEQRDKGYRAIAKCGLSHQHRGDIAKRPYVTQAEIDALVAAGLLFTWQGGDPTKPAAKGLPGVVDGRLYPSIHTWAIAIPNHLGQVAGVQLRNPKGGYFWASSASKGGAAPNLASGELPLGVYGTAAPDGVVNAGEGYFKPALSAQRHGGAWVGMAGGQWAKAPQQLRAALDALGCKVVVLNADGGAIANPLVMRSYGELAALLASWGIPLSVRWWWQATKADGDCDEIDPLKFKAAKFISWAEFEAMATPATKGEKTRAKDTKELKRRQTIERAQAILNQALPPAHRETEGGYLPELPPLLPGFAGYAIDAGLGAGKTTAIGRDIVDPTRDAFGFTLGLGPRNSLLAQTAEKHGLVHIRDFKTDPDSNQALGLVARDKGGLECCVNSLIRAEQHIPDRSTLVVDEAMATFTEAFEGGTLKGRYSETLSLLFGQMRAAKRVHIAESGLDQATLDMVERVRGERLMVIRHHGTVAPWQVHLATGSSPNGMFAQMFEQLHRGERLWLETTSLDEATALDLWARDNGINSMLITGETNEDGAFDDFFRDPDPELEQRQVQFLISTQSAQTGLSVEQYHFDAIYGYAPGFPVEVAYQMLGRYRQPCPRYVWVPAFIPPSRWEQPRKASALAEINHEVGQWAARGFNPAAADPDQALIDDYLAARWEKAWAQKVIPGAALTMMLERAGHTVTPWELTPDEATKAVRAAYREKLARRRAEGHAALEIDPEIHTAQWAKAKRDDGEATYRDRCIIRKLSTLEKFPGVDWDNPEIWYQAWFVRRHDDGEQTHGPIGPGAGLWAECSAVDLLQGKAGDEAAAILAQRLRSIKLLPDYGVKLALLAPMRPLCEQILAQGTTAPGCPLVRRLAAMARALGDDLYRYLRIVASDGHSDQAIAHKILRKFGLTVARSTYRKQGRTRQWSYTVAAPPLWQALVDARQIALDALRGKAHSGVTDLLEESFNKSVTPPPGNIPPGAWDDLRALLKQAMKDGAAAIEDLKDMVLAAFSPQVWASLEEVAA